MKLSYFFMAAAMVALSACPNKDAKVSDAQDAQQEQTEHTEQTAEVTVLDFNATWCGPCQKLGPIFDAISAKYPEVEFVSVDIDNNPKTAELFGVSSIPQVTLIAPDGRTQTYVGLVEEIYPLEAFQKTLDDFIAGK